MKSRPSRLPVARPRVPRKSRLHAEKRAPICEEGRSATARAEDLSSVTSVSGTVKTYCERTLQTTVATHKRTALLVEMAKHPLVLTTSQTQTWHYTSSIARHVVNVEFPCLPQLKNPEAIRYAVPQEQAALQSSLEAHTDVLKRFLGDEAALKREGVVTAEQHAVINCYTRPIQSSFVLMGKYKGQRNVLRSLNGTYFAVRGHMETIEAIFSRMVTSPGCEHAVASMTLFPCAFGGITHSGFVTPMVGRRGISALREYTGKPVPSDTVVLTESPGIGDWKALRALERDALDRAALQDMQDGQPRLDAQQTLAGHFIGSIFGYSMHSDVRFQLCLRNKIKVDGMCPCESGRAYRHCHKSTGTLPMCVVQYPKVNAAARAACFQGKNPDSMVHHAIAGGLESSSTESEYFAALEERKAVFDIESLDGLIHCLQAVPELVCRPYSKENWQELEFILAGFVRMTIAEMSTVGSSDDPVLRPDGSPNRFMTFGNLTIRRKPNTLLLHAMAWSRY